MAITAILTGLDPIYQSQFRSLLEDIPEEDHWLIYHAAFPVALTSDLLYKILVNFRPCQDSDHVTSLEKVSVLLLSPVCKPVTIELYEIHHDIRLLLIEYLKIKEGPERMLELARFCQSYVVNCGNKIPTPAFGETLLWMSEAYLNPDNAARTLLKSIKTESSASQPNYRLQYYITWAKQIRKTLTGNDEIQSPLLNVAINFAEGIQLYQSGLEVDALEKFTRIKELITPSLPFQTDGFQTRIPRKVLDKLEILPINKSRSEQQYVNYMLAAIVAGLVNKKQEESVLSKKDAIINIPQSDTEICYWAIAIQLLKTTQFNLYKEANDSIYCSNETGSFLTWINSRSSISVDEDNMIFEMSTPELFGSKIENIFTGIQKRINGTAPQSKSNRLLIYIDLQPLIPKNLTRYLVSQTQRNSLLKKIETLISRLDSLSYFESIFCFLNNKPGQIPGERLKDILILPKASKSDNLHSKILVTYVNRLPSSEKDSIFTKSLLQAFSGGAQTPGNSVTGRSLLEFLNKPYMGIDIGHIQNCNINELVIINDQYENTVEKANDVLANRTLIAEVLSNSYLEPDDMVVNPFYSLNEVFNYYEPYVKIKLPNYFTDSSNATIYFNKLEDFTPEGIILNNDSLKELALRKLAYSLFCDIRFLNIIKAAFDYGFYAFGPAVTSIIRNLPNSADKIFIHEIRALIYRTEIAKAIRILDKVKGKESLLKIIIDNIPYLPKTLNSLLSLLNNTRIKNRFINQYLEYWEQIIKNRKITGQITKSIKIAVDDLEEALETALLRIALASEHLERSYRNIDAFFKNVGKDRLNNVSFLNVPLPRQEPIHYNHFKKFLTEEISGNYTTQFSKGNYSLIILSHTLPEKIVDEVARVAAEYKAILIISDTILPKQPYFNKGIVKREFDYYCNTISVNTNILVRKHPFNYNPLYIPLTGAIGGLLYRTPLNSADSIYYQALQTDEITISESLYNDIKPKAPEWTGIRSTHYIDIYSNDKSGKVLALPMNTFYNGQDFAQKSLPAIRICDYISKELFQMMCNLQITDWNTHTEKILYKTIHNKLTKIIVPGGLFHKFENRKLTFYKNQNEVSIILVLISNPLNLSVNIHFSFFTDNYTFTSAYDGYRYRMDFS